MKIIIRRKRDQPSPSAWPHSRPLSPPICCGCVLSGSGEREERSGSPQWTTRTPKNMACRCLLPQFPWKCRSSLPAGAPGKPAVKDLWPASARDLLSETGSLSHSPTEKTVITGAQVGQAKLDWCEQQHKQEARRRLLPYTPSESQNCPPAHPPAASRTACAHDTQGGTERAPYGRSGDGKGGRYW